MSDRRSGVLIALATVVVGALLLWAAIATVRWLWPSGQLLTLSKPTGGTIVGPDLECGTRGSDCSTTVAAGESVQLEARADKGYVFSGFTGDCAPAGRPFMSEPRNCGARFDAVAAAAPSATFRLTIINPKGGTIVGPLGILCGTLGNTCSADVPSGVPVTLRAQADDRYTWEQFTGDCPSNGETTMTGEKTCGATFAQTSAPLANRGPDRPPIAASRPRPRAVDPPKPTSSAPQPGVVQNPPAAPSGSTPPPIPTMAETPTVAPDKPVARPQTPEEHARDEIQQLVKNYCVALESLKPERVRKLFHLDNESELKKGFREVRSLRCTVTSAPEYDRLDASSAGAAQVRFGMKKEVKMASGGAEPIVETIVTMTVSRKDFQSPWLIDRVDHARKPN